MTAIALIILCVSLTLRLMPRMVHTQAVGYDVWLYLTLARMLKARGHRFMRYRPTAFPYQYCANQGYPWLLSWLPAQWLPKVERISSQVLDTLCGLMVLAGSLWLANEFPQAFPAWTPVAVTIMFAFSPLLLRIASGPRAYTGTPRVLGETLYLAHALLALAALQTGSVALGLLSALACAFLVVTAVFGNQVLVFFGLALTIAVPAYGLILLSGAGLALLLLRGTAWRSVKSQVVHSLWYFTCYRHVFIGLKPRSFAQYLQSWREHGWPKLRARKLPNFMNWSLDEGYPPHLLVVCMPAALLLALPTAKGWSNPAHAFLTAWALAGVTAFFATKTRPLFFLGEGERYLEYSVFPILLLGASALRSEPTALWLLVGLTTLLGVRCLRRAPSVLAGLEQSVNAHCKAVDMLNTLPPGPVFVLGYSAYQALFFGKQPLIGYPLEEAQAIMPQEDFLLFTANYPLPHADFTRVQQVFGPRYLYGQRWAFEAYAKRTGDPAAFWDGLTLLHDHAGVLVCEVKARQ